MIQGIILDKKSTLIKFGEKVKNIEQKYEGNLEKYINGLKSEKI